MKQQRAKQLEWLRREVSPTLGGDFYGYIKVQIMGGNIIRIERLQSVKFEEHENGITQGNSYQA